MRIYQSQALPLFFSSSILMLCVGCNFPVGTKPAIGPATQAAQTVEAVLTQTDLDASFPSDASSTENAPQEMKETESPSQPVDNCTNVASFIADMTIQDNTSLLPGQLFVKTWRLANMGTCIWDKDYSLVFFGGDRMNAPSEMSLPATVHPGESVDLSVEMEAPSEEGVYQGFWRLRNLEDEYFGLGQQGRHSFWVKIQVIASPVTPSTND